jgi:hypothetical protein
MPAVLYLDDIAVGDAERGPEVWWCRLTLSNPR